MRSDQGWVAFLDFPRGAKVALPGSTSRMVLKELNTLARTCMVYCISQLFIFEIPSYINLNFMQQVDSARETQQIDGCSYFSVVLYEGMFKKIYHRLIIIIISVTFVF